MKFHIAVSLIAFSLLITPALATPADDLLFVDRAFARTSVEKGYDEAFIAYLAVDGQTFTGPKPIKSKADAVARHSDPNRAPSTVTVSWEPETGSVSADGTLGWTEGRFRRTGPNLAVTGHYITVWVHEGGSWKVRADLGSVDPKP